MFVIKIQALSTIFQLQKIFMACRVEAQDLNTYIIRLLKCLISFSIILEKYYYPIVGYTIRMYILNVNILS